MVCIDSDIIINFLRKEKNAVELINQLKSTFDTIEQFLSEIEILLLEPKSSKKAAEIFESLSSEGQTVDALDVMIASIAMVNNEPILTLNKNHFERIPGVKLI